MDDFSLPILADPARLAALRATNLLDSEEERPFDRLTKLASRFLRTPISLVSLVDDQRQFFKSQCGLPEPWASLRQTPLSHSICQYVVATGKPLIVSDTLEDEQLQDNLAVTDLDVMAYLGYPLTTPDGHTIGTLCVIQTEPREWQEEDIEIVADLADVAMAEIALRQQMQAQQESEARFRLISELVSDYAYAVGVVDGRITTSEWVSGAFERVTGYSVAEFEAAGGWEKLVHPDDRASVIARAGILLAGKIAEDEFRLIGKDKKIRWLHDRARPVQENGRVARIVGAARDVTERKKVETELRQLNATLEQRVAERMAELSQRNQELDQFVYVASHDLKAPLRAIDNLAGWIAEDVGDQLPSASQIHLQTMRGRIRRMEKLLDDLLAYSRADRHAGMVELVDTKNLVAGLAALLGAKERVVIADDLPQIWTLRVPLETVLRNLISNALKHHYREDGQVWVTAVRKDDGNFTFSVCDDGPGIDPVFHERIFQMFQTLRPRDQVEGSGAGLAIVKKIVESRGGTVAVDSRLGEGATFTFSWLGEESH